MSKSTKTIVIIGVVSAIYVVLSLITFPIASGIIQFRLSEGLCLLPLIFPETALSLFFGCLITNLITGCAVFDVVFGSLISLVAGILTAIIGKTVKKLTVRIIVGGIFPVLLNALLLPLIWYYCYGKMQELYILEALYLTVSQTVSVYGVGSIIVINLKKLRI